MNRTAATVPGIAPLAVFTTARPGRATSRSRWIASRMRAGLLVALSFIVAWLSPTVSDSLDARHWRIGAYGFEPASVLVAFFLGLVVLLIAEGASHLRFGRHFSAAAAIGIAALLGWALLEVYFMGVCLIGNASGETFVGKGWAVPDAVDQVLLSRSALAVCFLTALDAGFLGVVLGSAPAPIPTRSLTLGARSRRPMPTATRTSPRRHS